MEWEGTGSGVITVPNFNDFLMSPRRMNLLEFCDGVSSSALRAISKRSQALVAYGAAGGG